MNITKDQFAVFEEVITLLPHGEAYKRLSPKKRDLINQYIKTMNDLVDKRKRDNKRIASYIAEKRKDNKNYAR